MAFFTSTRVKIILIFVFLVIVFQTCKLYSDRITDKESDMVRQPVEVIVYYEALCPDSKFFFTHHLEDAHNKLKENINIKLVPYGKAKTFVSDAGEINFECQHGELECFANKIHACTINRLPNVVDHLPVTTCMIKDNMDPEEALKRCALTSDQEPILNCAKELKGSELLREHGVKTSKVNPNFIPTIHVNGAGGNLAALLKNFITELCGYFPASSKPSDCL